MRKAILAICCVAAFGIVGVGEASAFEQRSGNDAPQITEHHWGRGYHRGGGRGWGGGHRGGGWRGGCYGGGYQSGY